MTGYLLLFWACAMSGILIPAPEDLALVVAGAHLADGTLQFLPAALVAGVALLLRDAVFFGAGRILGEKVLERPIVQRLAGAEAIDRARGLVKRRGSVAVLAARAMLGFRVAGFLVAGAMGVRVSAFVLWDVIGLVISVPVVMGVGWLLGDQATVVIQWALDHAVLFLVVGAAALGWLYWSRRDEGDAEPVGA